VTDGSATHNTQAAATHTTREGLLAQLTRLLPAQFEELLFRAKLPPECLSASGTPQATRAIEVIRYFEQQNRHPELAHAIEYVVTRQDATVIRPEVGTRQRDHAPGQNAMLTACEPGRRSWSQARRGLRR
jgi:hypothetical protein